MAEGRRLFFALWPDAGLQRSMAAAGAAAARSAGVEGRTVRTEGLHLTLLFLGQVAVEAESTLQAAAARVVAPAFSLQLDRLDTFAAAKVLWLGCRTVPDELGLLAGRLREAAAGAGVEFDRRPLVPHVTVQRDVVRSPGPAAIAPIRWDVDRFALVLSAPGSRYHVVSHWPLQNGTADLY